MVTPLTFSPMRIVPEPDVTEYAVQTVGGITRDFEQACTATGSVDRCKQLQARLFVISQLISDADFAVRMRIYDLIEKGLDT